MAKEHFVTGGASIGATATVHLAISKALSVPVRGFLEAVDRTRAAATQHDVDGLFIGATEASHWVISISEREATLKQDLDVAALCLVRGRAHHHLGSIVSQERHMGSETA
jgi:hypothetical protein